METSIITVDQVGKYLINFPEIKKDDDGVWIITDPSDTKIFGITIDEIVMLSYIGKGRFLEVKKCSNLYTLLYKMVLKFIKHCTKIGISPRFKYIKGIYLVPCNKLIWKDSGIPFEIPEQTSYNTGKEYGVKGNIKMIVRYEKSTYEYALRTAIFEFEVSGTIVPIEKEF